MDDPFGKIALDETNVYKWEDEAGTMTKLLGIENEFERMMDNIPDEQHQMDFENTRLLISCRLHLYMSNRLDVIKHKLQMEECNLHSKELCLAGIEKSEMFAMYVKSCTITDINSDRHFPRYYAKWPSIKMQKA